MIKKYISSKSVGQFPGKGLSEWKILHFLFFQTKLLNTQHIICIDEIDKIGIFLKAIFKISKLNIKCAILVFNLELIVWKQFLVLNIAIKCTVYI